MTSAWGVRILATVVIATVIAAVVAAIVILGPPSQQRKRKLDQRRIRDLMNIEQTVNSYWQRHKTLPPDLVTLSREPGFRPPTSDPERGSVYEFKVTGTDSFRLCAEFSFDSKEDPQPWYYSPTGPWAHGAGRQCFELTIQRPESVK